MTRYIVSLLILLSAVLPLRAISVESVAGSLSEAVPSPETVGNLVVTGTVNVIDLYFIAENMPALRSLDLSGAEIAEYSGKRFHGLSVHPAGVIPARVFAASPLESVVLPATKGLSIGDGAFAGSALKSVDIPATVTGIGAGAFAACPALKTATIAATPGVGAFSGCKALEIVTISAGLALPANVFENCIALTTVNGSEGVTAVGDRAFAGCTALQSFSFGKGLTSIGASAFAGSGLTRADFAPATALASVGDWAFAACPALASINFGSVASLGRGVAFDCPALTDVTFSTTAAEIPDFTFAKIPVEEALVIPEGVTSIGQQAFSGASAITKFQIPQTVEYIGDNAMEGMSSLHSFRSDATVPPTLGSNVWQDVNQNLVQLDVPNDAVDTYRAAEQWKEFDVHSISGLNPDIDVETAVLRARFEGTTLIVDCGTADISRLSLFDPSGAVLVSVGATGGMATVDTAPFTCDIFIVAATMADGSVASLKIARR